jgi:5-methyltetrahydrofolate--homocysteine methyltransferase
METVLSSKTKTVVIGPEQPFTIIGERINPTGRKKLAAAMAEGDFSMVAADAQAQVAAGAAMLDVNSGVPGADEPEIMRMAVQTVMEAVSVPLCFDSPNPAALEAALEIYSGKALINSTTGEQEALERVLPLAKKYSAAVICLCNDERGPIQDPFERLGVAKKIIAHASDYGIPPEDLLFDPLVMTVSSDSNAGRVTLETIRLLKQELGVNMTGGASNVSFGLPDRPSLNATFINLAVGAGLNSAITNPLDEDVRKAILAADLFLGRDEYCGRWIRFYRQREKAKQQSG